MFVYQTNYYREGAEKAAKYQSREIFSPGILNTTTVLKT